MQGPSLDAIRKVKEQLERRKRDEEERKVKDKLSILEHRASQGDRKAKKELKELEKIKETRSKPPDEQQLQKQTIFANNASRPNSARKPTVNGTAKSGTTRCTKGAIMDFDELMKLAEQNKNPKPAPPTQPAIGEELKRKHLVKPNPKPTRPLVQTSATPVIKKPIPSAIALAPQASIRKHPMQPQSLPKPPPAQAVARKLPERQPAPAIMRQKPIRADKEEIQSAEVRAQLMRLRQMRAQQQRMNNHNQSSRQISYDAHQPDLRGDYDDYGDYSDYDEDHYEQDDFVVDDDEDDVQNEISRTIRSVFKYDKSRCDARERAVELEYQRIGNVSTFEDLEREERRAARLGAAEDAQAEREEEERKRRKKLRRMEKSRR